MALTTRATCHLHLGSILCLPSASVGGPSMLLTKGGCFACVHDQLSINEYNHQWIISTSTQSVLCPTRKQANFCFDLTSLPATAPFFCSPSQQTPQHPSSSSTFFCGPTQTGSQPCHASKPALVKVTKTSTDWLILAHHLSGPISSCDPVAS